MDLCNVLPEKKKKTGDVADENTSCWLQKASKMYEVLEINIVTGVPERGKEKCAWRGHLRENKAKKLSDSLWVRRMKGTSADTNLEDTSAVITSMY